MSTTTSFHDFSARSLRGDEVPMADFAGQVVLVVNTASECGFTPQYAGLEALYQKFRDQGFVVLAFPCNQFGGQEPGGASEIEQVCRVNYGVTFPVFEKVEVNGAGAHPLFDWLTRSLGGLLTRAIKWNFTKFLIGRDGVPLERFSPTTKPEELEDAISQALQVA
jgi:glutathione peroxidase